jgi:hypothetical protein
VSLLRGPISFGQLFAALLPFACALAIICSTWVLADARRRRLTRYAIIAWTLGTLLLPCTVLPLYLLTRLWSKHSTQTQVGSFWSRHAPTLLYAFVVLLSAALYFVHDYRGRDARLARASDARLHGEHAHAAREYRAALKLMDDPHTHKLLGLELVALQQWPDALTELRAAERSGEPDAALPFHIAVALDALGRHDEAINEYQQFLAGALCNKVVPDARCARAQAHLAQAAGE